MESIVQAVNLVRGDGRPNQGALAVANDAANKELPVPQLAPVPLGEAALEKHRIIGHRESATARRFDILRTEVLQEMDKNGWQFLGVTSPTAGCGKSTVACNLAMSLGRLVGRPPLLVDLDIRKPSVARYLGLRCELGIVDVLKEKADLAQVVKNVSAGPASLAVLPAKGETRHSSDLLVSDSMTALLQVVKREYRNRIVIFDLPSVLAGDDVSAILPRLDALILVTGADRSKIADIQECRRVLERSPVIRVVVNKVAAARA